MTQIVNLYLLFVSIYRFLFRQPHDASVVDKDVNLFDMLGQFLHKVSHARETSQIQSQSDDFIATFNADFLSDLLGFVQIPAANDNLGSSFACKVGTFLWE